jgi:hypothetical protein
MVQRMNGPLGRLDFDWCVSYCFIFFRSFIILSIKSQSDDFIYSLDCWNNLLSPISNLPYYSWYIYIWVPLSIVTGSRMKSEDLIWFHIFSPILLFLMAISMFIIVCLWSLLYNVSFYLTSVFDSSFSYY